MPTKKIKFSPNAKLNYVLNDIYEDLKELGKSEVLRYKKSYPGEIDFCIAQNGHMRVYYYQIRDLYKKAGYAASMWDKWSDDKLWNTYLRQVGYVARYYF